MNDFINTHLGVIASLSALFAIIGSILAIKLIDLYQKARKFDRIVACKKRELEIYTCIATATLEGRDVRDIPTIKESSPIMMRCEVIDRKIANLKSALGVKNE